MRVLQLGKYYYPYMGGIETHIEMLCRGLHQEVDVEAVVFNTEPRTLHENVDGVRLTRCAEFLRVASNSISLAMIAELSRREFDLVHLHVPNPMAAAAYLAASKPTRHRLVVTHHSDIVRQTTMKHFVRPIMRLIMERADAIIATSPNYLATSTELRPYLSKCHVIPYGIDLERFEPELRDESAAAEIRKSLTGPIILAVGRLIYYKGFEVVIKAMAKVAGSLLLVGEGPLREQLESLSRELGLTGRIQFVGGIQNHALLPYYLASDVFVLPSVVRSEAFGIVQLEAMAARLPVVNTKLNSGVPYVSRHLETGLTVEPGDVAALSDALNRLLEHGMERKRFGEAARARVEQNFSAPTMTRRHLDLYAQLTKPESTTVRD
jgi:glycosyltransferase involved in cell wall biosynthesis